MIYYLNFLEKLYDSIKSDPFCEEIGIPVVSKEAASYIKEKLREEGIISRKSISTVESVSETFVVIVTLSPISNRDHDE